METDTIFDDDDEDEAEEVETEGSQGSDGYGCWDMLTWLLGMMDLPGRAKLVYGPEDGEEGTTWPPMPEIAFGNLRNWSQGLSWGHVPGSGS